VASSVLSGLLIGTGTIEPVWSGVRGEPFSSRAPDAYRDLTADPLSQTSMTKFEHQYSGDEPVGIVISRGSREVPPSRFLAYEYAPAPDDTVDASAVVDEQKAA
jgi:hypothetical protein